MRFGISIFLLFVHYCLLAQLVSPDAVSTRYTSYPSAPGTRDQIFIYCNSSGSQKGSLSARIPENKAPSDFAWYRWNTSASSFSIAVKTETAVRSSSLANLDPGGYRVIISGGHDTIMTAWIVFDETPFVSAKLMNPMKHCNYVALDGTAGAAVSSFGYFDPLDGRALSLKNEVSFLWSSEPESSIPYPSLELDPKIFTPPLVDVVYTLRVNTLGCSSSDTIDYKSIHVKADFTLDPLKGEAPLEVAITDKSVRAHVYEWDFGDDTISTLNDPLIHTYYKPGEYT
ncbi:MAG TPA: PKD domain-containing protein, partial [Bacteroidales bacterium]|nr:PKD domain-containing protein [Bacteroidales bacterium]